MRALVLGGVAALVLSGCATQAPFLHTRAGVTEAQLFSDSEACTAVAKTGGAGAPGAPYNPALPSQAGAAMGAGIAEGFVKARAEKAGYEGCMAERGYLRVTLTDAEYAQFRTTKGEARKVWLAAFAARDHGARAAAAPTAKPCVSNALRRCAGE